MYTSVGDEILLECSVQCSTFFKASCCSLLLYCWLLQVTWYFISCILNSTSCLFCDVFCRSFSHLFLT